MRYCVEPVHNMVNVIVLMSWVILGTGFVRVWVLQMAYRLVDHIQSGRYFEMSKLGSDSIR